MSKAVLFTAQVKVPTNGTPVVLASTPSFQNNVVITGLPGNTGNVYVAPLGTTPKTGGMVLAAKEALDLGKFGAVDLSQLRVDSDTNNEGISITAVNTLS